MSKESLIIKKRADDGHRVISVRISNDLLAQLDKLADETKHSRNELINLMLQYGVKNIEIE